MDMQMALDIQELKTLLRDAKRVIKVFRKRFNITDQQLLEDLKYIFPDLNEDQLQKLMRETK